MSTTNRAMDTVPSNSLQPSVPINADLTILDAAIYGLSTIEFATDANRTLTATECDCSVLRLTDSPTTLTAGRDVVFPDRFPLMLVQNATAQTLTLKKSGQTGVTINAGAEAIVMAGATDVVKFSGGGATAAGSTKQIQYNNAGAFGAEAGFEYDAATNTLTVVNIILSGLLLTTASATGSAGFRMPHGAAPTSPTDGDVWTTSAGMYVRINGVTVGPLAAAGGGGSLTGFTSSLETASPNNTVNVSKMAASGGTTDQDAVLQPKGQGGIAGQTADSTATGGNKRGSKAVDLQLQRSAATQVASGAESFIGAGRNNTASAANAGVVAGQSNTGSGQSSGILGGESQTASGQRSACVGGSTGTASGNDAVTIGGGTASGSNSVAVGPAADTRLVVGAVSVGMVSGSHPRDQFTLTGSTTSATPVVLTTNGAAAAATNQPYFGNANNRSAIARIMIVARKTGNGGGKKSWQGFAHLDRDNDTMSIVGSATMTVVGDSGVSWSVSVTADNTLKVLKVEATGEASTTIRWACYVDWQEVAGS